MKDTASFVPIRLITHNIRYATDSPYPEEAPWAERKKGVISQFRYHANENSSSSQFICLQEVLHEQLLDILAGLNTVPKSSSSPSSTSIPSSPNHKRDTSDGEWSYIGAGRLDGKTEGEYNPILYRPSVWTLLDSSTVWLSETPSKPSKSWDAASIRILTYGVFRHATSRKIVLAMNTHLDDQGAQSREEGAKIVLKVLRELVVKGRRWDVNGAFLCGDLNSKIDGEAYKILNEKGSGLKDLVEMLPDPKLPSPSSSLPFSASEKKKRKEKNETSTPITHYGDSNTYTAFGASDPNVAEAPSRIDFIHLETADLVREKEDRWNMDTDDDGSKHPWEVDGYAVLPNRFEDDGVWISDHRAVVGDVRLVK